MVSDASNVYIIGAGPAGLSAAYELVKRGIFPIVLEASQGIGGISRTEMHQGYRFDIGGHRFFTKNYRLQQLWQDIMGDDLLTVERRSRIYSRERLFDYPLRLENALFNLGAKESLLVALSYLFASLKSKGNEASFEQWVCNRFGRRLYKHFFKTYTEKVWGIPCDEIHAEWASERIQGLSLSRAVLDACLGSQNIPSLVNRFNYPRLGSGMMWERLAEQVEHLGGRVIRGARVVRLIHQNNRIKRLVYKMENREMTVPASAVLSSAPLPHLVNMLSPTKDVRKATGRLRHRAFIMVLLMVRHPSLFSDQWIYIHQPDLRVGRIQNFKNWSAAMVPDDTTSSIGMEYFCDEGDALWRMTDTELEKLAVRELAKLRICSTDRMCDTKVVRQPHAYPIYQREYHASLFEVRRHLEGFHNLFTMGRNGTHQYINMDHAMSSGFLAARAALGEMCNSWEVNGKGAYLESGVSGSEQTFWGGLPGPLSGKANKQGASPPSPLSGKRRGGVRC